MASIDLAELPPALAEHVSRRARLTFPSQGKTSDVAFAEHEGRVVVVKRCAHRVYLDWLRREHAALRVLAGSGLPIPRFIAYAESEQGGQPVGWLLMSRLAGTPFLDAAIEAQPRQRVSMFRRLGQLAVAARDACSARAAHEGSWLSRQIERPA
jgi:aminoglycoside phosphotransferase